MHKLNKGEYLESDDEYELNLLDAVEISTEFQRVENFEDELLEATMAANNFLKKTKNVSIRIPDFDILLKK